MLSDIHNLSDIQQLVTSFYAVARKDDLLGPIFDHHIPDEAAWPAHVDRITAFWEGILLGGTRYQGQPFTPHRNMPLEKKHFDCWVQLFCEAVDRNFEGQIAEMAKHRARTIAPIFLHKINMQRGSM